MNGLNPLSTFILLLLTASVVVSPMPDEEALMIDATREPNLLYDQHERAQARIDSIQIVEDAQYKLLQLQIEAEKAKANFEYIISQ